MAHTPVTAVGEQTSLADRKRRAGQRLIIGLNGFEPSADFQTMCRKMRPAGFILFSRNIAEPQQVRELNRELASFLPASAPPLLSIDQEGGRVLRINQTAWPPQQWLGNADDIDLTKRVARSIGDELYACGFNTNWAPVADLNSRSDGPIGNRSFSADPQRCAHHVAASISGLHDAGIMAVAKHFPGHGLAPADSHDTLPTIEEERPALVARDLKPFSAAIQAGVSAIMTAHVCYPAWEEDIPATMSSRILRGVLREDMNYRNVIVSDDLEMKAVRGRFTMAQQLDAACRASVDLFLVCHSPDRQWEAFETLIHLQETDPSHDTWSTDSMRRLHALRQRHFLQRPKQPDIDRVGCRHHRSLVQQVQERGQT